MPQTKVSSPSPIQICPYSTPFQKRKRDDTPAKINDTTRPTHSQDTDTSKPTAVFTPTIPRASTLSVALPGSIIANAKSHDQKTYLAGTIARALAVFNVDEVVIFNDEAPPASPSDANASDQTNGSHRGSGSGRSSTTDDGEYTALTNPSHFLSHILSYLETPPHLRRALFPIHPNLRTAGTLPSLDMPHHLRANEYCPYREGVTVSNSKAGTKVDLGLSQPYVIRDVQIPPNTRVTLRMPDSDSGKGNTKQGGSLVEAEAEAVSPSTPREEGGYYWGYSVRQSPSLSAVFTECPFDGGYDLSFGTSERGSPIADIASSTTSIPPYTHMLICFGGVAGLEHAAKNDPALSAKGITGPKTGELFDYWVNLVPNQGSRTIRTEEAVWCGLMGLRSVVEERRMSG